MPLTQPSLTWPLPASGPAPSSPLPTPHQWSLLAVPQSLQVRPEFGGEPSVLAALKARPCFLSCAKSRRGGGWGGVWKAAGTKFKKLPAAERSFNRARSTNTRISENMKSWAWWCMLINPSTGEVETGRLLASLSNQPILLSKHQADRDTVPKLMVMALEDI